MTNCHAHVGGLDHVGLVVADIEGAAKAFAAVGFALTPISMHSGALVPGEAPVPLGTGNRCAMFRTGYLELISVIDPSRPSGVYPELLARYEGLHIVAFSSGDPQGTAATLAARGVPIDGVFQLTRKIETATCDGEARFNILRISRTYAPEGRVIFLRHETPGLLWEPHGLQHANGAEHLSFVTMVVADVEEAGERYSRLLGCEPSRESGKLTYRLAESELHVCSPEHARRSLGVSAPCLPFNAAFGIAVANLDAVRTILRRNDVPFLDKSSQLIVDQTFLCGTACVFHSRRS